MNPQSFLKSTFLFSYLLIIAFSYSQNKRIGLFEGQSDIGKVLHAGTVSYNPQTEQYAISGSGSNIWNDNDEFHFVWKKMKGNFILTSYASLLGKGIELHRKLGWMVRSNLEGNAPHVSAVVHGDGLTSLQFRPTSGGLTEEKKSALQAADVIELERKNNTYIMRVAHRGSTFTEEEVLDLSLGDDVYVGLFVCSHNKDVTEKALFRNVRIVVPARDSLVQYKEYLGSNLEILDIATASRKIIYQSTQSLQAPNWTKDGKNLIYNSEGLLYRFDIDKKKPVEINSDFAKSNNNDHVISFDGKWLGISNHAKEDNNVSIVYVLPLSGGKPRRITALGPSYLHGWSPDGKWLAFVGERENEFDIYKIPVKGGEEIRLTTEKGLDDGCEYSPDGKYIYFNSVRSGSMQLWRMKPDGNAQEQITNDEFNNWFPHISPNGKWIVFISFLKDVDPSDHPFYKHVYLRLMPIGGGTTKVIAYLYGGQGTINTPSWSPDSKKIAFVSNSEGNE